MRLESFNEDELKKFRQIEGKLHLELREIFIN